MLTERAPRSKTVWKSVKNFYEAAAEVKQASMSTYLGYDSI